MNFDIQNDLKALLNEIFGFTEFRPGQLEIIEAILSKKSVLAVMPTGAGKSLCYQLPAIYSDQMTIVISPLVALIDDQVAALKQLGVGVSKIHSGLSREENVENWKRFVSGDSKIIYMSPERLMQPRMLETLQKLPIGMFVVDEAHCISKWGADFRPDYEELAQLKQLFPSSVIAAFTATADRATRADIVEKLTRNECKVFVKGFDRPNLSLKVLPKQDLKGKLLAFLSERKNQSGIVYCLSRNETDQICEFLKRNGFNAISYHAGKDAAYRKDAQNRFMTESAAVMVATVAFGMGIDKPDIRYVVHASMPSSVEAFYQEIGRAGRDNERSDTILFYGLQDIMKRQRMIFEGDGSEQHKLLEYKRLEALVGYCETTACRRLALLSYFDEAAEICNNCDNCLNPPDVQDYSREAKLVLTAIKETGQYFGVTHIIDVIRGSETAKVKARSHNRLEVFGSAAAKPKQFFQSIIRQLVAGNSIRVNLEKYGALEITEKGMKILYDQERFLARAFLRSTSSVADRNSAISKPEVKTKNTQLLAELKKVRLELARARAVPAFVIFSDKTLIQMAEEMPTTESEFLSISGVGKAKFEEFYEPFSQAILLFLSNANEVIEVSPDYDQPVDQQNLDDEAVNVNPEGIYYKLEEQASFSPLNKAIPDNFSKNLHNLYKKRSQNLSMGKMINHGMPFSVEERDDLARRFATGQSVRALSDFYQRTAFAIEVRLEQLGLIKLEPDESVEHDVRQATDNSVYCESCGEAIPALRLEAMPNTRVCVDCKEYEEDTPDVGVVFPPVPTGLAGDCPRCKHGVAVVYQNHTDKSFFVGCSKFPNCRWSRNMD